MELSSSNTSDEFHQLASPILLKAKVVTGFGRGGKQLGCPTANMCPKEIGEIIEKLDTGIYFGWASVNGKGPYKAVTSIGWNPYFKNKEKTVEPHLLHEFPQDFYGEELKLVLCGYLRQEKDFPSLELLIETIQNDIRIARDELDKEKYEVFSSMTME